MRFLIICSIYIAFCGIGAFSLYSNDAYSHQDIGDEIWADYLQAFQKLLKTDPEAARAELQDVAKTLFGEHRLVEEWVPLYFRINQEGTEHPSDFVRVSELEIRMLIAIDAKNMPNRYNITELY